ncbi:hypothetical protein [Streptomyces lydicus]
MHRADPPARRRLSAALQHLAAAFRGMTAHPGEDNTELVAWLLGHAARRP